MNRIIRGLTRAGFLPPQPAPAPPPPDTDGLGLLELEDIRTLNRSVLEGKVRARTVCAPAGAGAHLIRVLGRYKMFVIPEDDSISGHLTLDGFWEMWHTIFLARLIPRGSRIIEVGANLGYFSVLLADLAGPEGRIAAFEPVTRTAGLLKRSLHINGFSGMARVERCAVADREGVARISVPEGNWGGGSILGDNPDAAIAAAEETPVVTLDAWCAAHEFWPDFIKIDAEGAEQAVWRGMAGVLARQPRIAVMLEFDWFRTPGWRAWFAELAAQGFSLNRITHESGLAPVSADMPEPTAMYDLLIARNWPGLPA